jgi:hypothetical protein
MEERGDPEIRLWIDKRPGSTSSPARKLTPLACGETEMAVPSGFSEAVQLRLLQ